MFKYEVGKPYNANRTRWEEGTNYNFRSNMHEILLTFRNPKPIEVQSVKTGEANFGLVVQDDVILLVFKFGAIPWSDASYTWHRLALDERTLPKAPEDLGPEERSTVTTFLVNADTGILLAIRQTSFSHDFTVKLHQAIIEQSHKPFDQVLFDRQLRKLYSQHDSKSLLSLAIARCKGGD
jgi:hypothetical protein